MKLTSPERTVHLPELWPNASKPRSKRFEGSEECKYPIMISFYRRQRIAWHFAVLNNSEKEKILKVKFSIRKFNLIFGEFFCFASLRAKTVGPKIMSRKKYVAPCTPFRLFPTCKSALVGAVLRDVKFILVSYVGIYTGHFGCIVKLPDEVCVSHTKRVGENKPFYNSKSSQTCCSLV